MITYLRYTSNAFIFSAALPPVMTAVALKAFDIIETEKDRIQKLQSNINTFITRVKEMGFNTLKSKDTPIIQNAHIAVGHIICEIVENQF